MQTTCPQKGDTLAIAGYPGQLFECLGYDQNGSLLVCPVQGSGFVQNVAGMLADPAPPLPSTAGAPTQQQLQQNQADLAAQLADAFAQADFSLTATEQMISQLGHDQGQLDLWMRLSVGDFIPPGYGDTNSLVSYEMLTGQRDNWRLARDRSLETLIQQAQVFGTRVINTLVVLTNYLLGPLPDKAFATSYRDKMAPLINAMDTIGKIYDERLAAVLEGYRAQLKRVDFGLDKLKIPPLQVPSGLGWGLLLLAAIAAAAFGFRAGR